MKKGWLVLVLGLVVGCSTRSVIEYQIKTGVFTFLKSSSESHDFDVKLERVHDFNWDVANPEDRIMIIKQMLGTACIRPSISNEQYISRGKSAFGVEMGSYLIEVTCTP